MEPDSFMIRNASYLHARDPSIVAANWPKLRVNLDNQLEAAEAEVSQENEDANLCVYLRIKGGCPCENIYEISDRSLTCQIPEESHLARNFRPGESRIRKFKFSQIFNSESTQSDIFNSVIKQRLLNFINGRNSTLLTYGASGSGKTFTVIGTMEEPGIVPRSLEYLFNTLPNVAQYPEVKPLPHGEVTLIKDPEKEAGSAQRLLNSALSNDQKIHAKTYKAMQHRLSSEPVGVTDYSRGDVTINIWVSFAEIYNECIYDLLQPHSGRGKDRPRLQLGCFNGTTFIKDLININVKSGLEAYQILQHGLNNLKYASTKVNSHSSRSHSIFTIKLVQVCGTDGGVFVSCFNFCDLAGSERLKKTKNIGDRLKESNNINSSLLVLGRCISAVRKAQSKNDNQLVPFRESKLTQLFQRALSGLEDIAMIVNISPTMEMLDESQHVLNFSAIAKDIVITQQPRPRRKNRFSALLDKNEAMTLACHNDEVAQLTNTILMLEDQLLQCEINEKLNREHMIKGYTEIIKEVERSVEEQVAMAEDIIRKKYEEKIRHLKRHYENLLAENKTTHKNQNVIVIDDSSDDEDQKTIINDYKSKISRLEAQLWQLKLKINESNQENSQLQATVDDGLKLYKELEAEFNEQTGELEFYKDKCRELEYELSTYRKELLEARESTDQHPNVEESEAGITMEVKNESNVGNGLDNCPNCGKLGCSSINHLWD